MFSVVVPLALPGIISGVILVFIPCLGSFLTPDLLGGTNAQMIGNVIERQFKSANDWPFGATLSFVIIINGFVKPRWPYIVLENEICRYLAVGHTKFSGSL